MGLDEFVEKWAASGAAERANKDLFLTELCDVLGLPRPNPTTGDPEKDAYVFERDARVLGEGGTVKVGRIDLFRKGSFILEAKQGSMPGASKLGTARRGTPAWNIAMKDAFGQALGYARSFDPAVPFLIVCDIGHCFDLYASFDGTLNYRPFPSAQQSRLHFRDLKQHAELLRQVFLEPGELDPTKRAIRVTQEVAEKLATLGNRLEQDGHDPEVVSPFLMRCLFTMFAEDVGLLPNNMFTEALRDFWIPSPKSFPGGVEALWRNMNAGAHDFRVGKILQFNGGLFRDPIGLQLDRAALELLLAAAECDWADVEPAIFGTLLERALDPRERHRLGAHFTPRSFVERLVRPTIEEPLRQDWEVVQAEVRQLVDQSEEAPNEKSSRASLRKAVRAVRDFQHKLAHTHVLDPACGTGNFLYVSLEIFKRLESEVIDLLESLGESNLLHMDTVRITPAQFHGIEIVRWAKEIADVVLWIGYLQWHFRLHGSALPVPEPVLQDFGNIVCADAVLSYESRDLVLGPDAKPVTRWDGVTTKTSTVTGKEVPDETAQVPLYRYVSPSKPTWPKVDYVVGNPPFVGTRRMRLTLGDGYVEGLASAAPQVPENADFVMYWWDHAAELLRAGKIKRFGLITTNSIVQTFNRAVLHRHLTDKNPLSIEFAIPDHPWIDSADGAAIRVAMTVCTRGKVPGELLRVSDERGSEMAETGIIFRDAQRGLVTEDLRVGASPALATPLRANAKVAYWGVKFYGDGFIVTPEEAARLAPAGDRTLARPFISGRDLTKNPRELLALDCDGLSEEQLRQEFPSAYQWLLERVKPVRKHNPRKFKRERWWIFGENQPGMREAVRGLARYIVTTETAKHRVFHFVSGETLAEGTVAVIALDDPFFLGVLSSRAHCIWALAAGGRLGVGNDPRYNKTRCFDTFAFPTPDGELRARIGELAESLDAHRRSRLAEHADLTTTAMYNALAKLRSGAQRTRKDLEVHEKALISVLRQLHDELDGAVLEAYGWASDITDEQIIERLVALNKRCAKSEGSGMVAWLRPEFQDPDSDQNGLYDPSNIAHLDPGQTAAPSNKKVATPKWPSTLPDRISRVRDVVRGSSQDWSATQVAAEFRGAKENEVRGILDSLAALGVCVVYQVDGDRRWRSSTHTSAPPSALR